MQQFGPPRPVVQTLNRPQPPTLAPVLGRYLVRPEEEEKEDKGKSFTEQRKKKNIMFDEVVQPLCVCVHVCVCVCMCACVHVCVCLCACVC